MSASNTRPAKRARSLAQAARKEAAADRIRHCGVIVDRRMVLNHRYLAEQGLPHSKRVAGVFVGRAA